MGEKDITNIKEIMNLLDKLATVAENVLQDNKVDFWDIPKFVAIWPELQLAIEGASKIGGEIGDLDSAEVQEMGQLCINLVIRWAGVLKGKTI